MKTAKQQLSRNPSNAGYATPLKTYSVPATTNQDGTINVPVQPVGIVDPLTEPIPFVNWTNPAGSIVVKMVPGGTYVRQALAAQPIGATGNGFVAAVGQQYILDAMVCDVVCSATVGNRLFIVSIFDSANNEWVSASSAATAAGQTCGFDVAFGNTGTPSTTVRRNLANTGNVNVMVREFCPVSTLFAGWSVLIDDTANIDNADAVTMYLFYRSIPL